MTEMSAFEALMTIKDEVSAAVGKMTSQVDALGAAARRTETSLNFQTKLSDAGMLRNEAAMLGGVAVGAEAAGAGVEEAKEHFGRLREASGALIGSFTELLPMFAVFAGVGSAAGFVEMVRSTAETAENFEVLSRTIGISTAAVQKWDYIANLSGVSQDSMNTGLQKLNQNLGEVAAGRDKPMATLLQHLGISLRDNNGHLKNAAELLPALNKAFFDTQDPAMRAYMAITLFGKSGQDLLPILDQAPDKVNELADSYKKYAYQFTPQDTKNLDAFSDSWKNLGAAAEGLKDDLSAKMAPLITPIINATADWTAKNKDWIANDISHGIVNLAETLKEQSGEIEFYMHRIMASYGEQFSEVGHGAAAAAHFINPGTPDNASTNPGYAGNHPKAPPRANEAFRAGDARLPAPGGGAPDYGPGVPEVMALFERLDAILMPHPVTLKPAKPKHANEVIVVGDLRSEVYGGAPGGGFDGLPGLPSSTRADGGQVKVAITFENAPPGMQVRAAASGNVGMPNISTGRSSMASGHN